MANMINLISYTFAKIKISFYFTKEPVIILKIQVIDFINKFTNKPNLEYFISSFTRQLGQSFISFSCYFTSVCGIVNPDGLDKA